MNEGAGELEVRVSPRLWGAHARREQRVDARARARTPMTVLRWGSGKVARARAEHQ